MQKHFQLWAENMHAWLLPFLLSYSSHSPSAVFFPPGPYFTGRQPCPKIQHAAFACLCLSLGLADIFFYFILFLIILFWILSHKITIIYTWFVAPSPCTACNRMPNTSRPAPDLQTWYSRNTESKGGCARESITLLEKAKWKTTNMPTIDKTAIWSLLGKINE